MNTEIKLDTPKMNKNACGLCITLPNQLANDQFVEKLGPAINENGFMFYDRSSNVVESINSASNCDGESQFFVNSSEDLSTDRLSPIVNTNENECLLNPTLHELIPDWQDYLNECLFKWYVMGREKPTSGCLENMHLFLGGRRLSSLHSPTTHEKEIPITLQNDLVVLRRSGTHCSQTGRLNDDRNQNILTENGDNKNLVLISCDEITMVQYAELDALIVYALENLDSEFCATFVATYQSFISADKLIDKLVFQFNNCKEKDTNWKKNCLTLIIKISGMLSRYSITKDLLATLINFQHQLIITPELEGALEELRQICLLKHNEYNKIQMMVNIMPEYLGDTSEAIILDFKPHIIAQQMTLMSYELFSKIEVAELIVSEEKANKPNVTNLIKHCDKLSYWVTTIIVKLRKKREIPIYVKYFVKVMTFLKKHQDFNTCWAILVGLQTTYVYQTTIKYEHIFSEFIDLFSFRANYGNYRSVLKDSKVPRIPSLCIALHDLIYINEAAKRKKPAELKNSINFYGIWRQYKYIESFKEMNLGYLFQKNYEILKFFRNFENHIWINESP